jgi:acyl-coenzyme A synthetase/AMP-(fatty) acid ligase
LRTFGGTTSAIDTYFSILLKVLYGDGALRDEVAIIGLPVSVLWLGSGPRHSSIEDAINEHPAVAEEITIVGFPHDVKRYLIWFCDLKKKLAS